VGPTLGLEECLLLKENKQIVLKWLVVFYIKRAKDFLPLLGSVHCSGVLKIVEGRGFELSTTT